jgi:transcriptional regulator with PAS, ATPase and Fis domain
MSDRRNKAFVPVNCGAVPENLFEREFFGHRKGAFTGAHIDTHGFFDYAHEGTLFLDEVGELTLNMQVKLLRAIESGEYTPVGDNRIKKADFRIIAATNKDLTEMVIKGLIREDFFYRIHIIPVTVPPLRVRKQDIPLLVEHFLHLHGKGKKKHTITGKIIDTFYNYDWPGNVRQLQNVLHRYLIVGNLHFLNPLLNHSVEQRNAFERESPESCLTLDGTVENVEKTLIINALNNNSWNRNNTAAELDISRRTLFRKMKNFGLNLSQIGHHVTSKI